MSQWQEQIQANANAIQLMLDDAKQIKDHNALGVGISNLDRILIQLDSNDDTVYATREQLVGTIFNPIISGEVLGDLLVYNGTQWINLAAGIDGEILSSDSGEPTGLKWITDSGIPTLQQVADIGNTTTTFLRASKFEVGGANSWLDIVSTELTLQHDGQIDLINSTNGTQISLKNGNVSLSSDGSQFVNLQTNLLTADRTYDFANISGIIPMTVNGVSADAFGNIEVTGLNVPITTKGDIYTFSTVEDRLAVGTNGQVLTADSGESTGLKWTSAGAGDMVLASVQTVTGNKTFEDGTMILRNVADTFDGVFVNTNTADRIYTLQDSAGTLAFLTDITGDPDQTFANTSDATSHTLTLSGSGGSIKLIEGTNITLTTTGTGLNGIVTIASVDTGATQLSELSDVNTSTPTDKFFLIADGVDWESRLLIEADISDFGTYGDVTKVGTPVNDQIGVWTGDGTIEGDPQFTYVNGLLTIGETDTRSGLIQLLGHGTGPVNGGRIDFYLSDDYNTSITFYSTLAYQDDYVIWQDSSIIMSYDGGTSRWRLDTYGGGTITGTDAFLLAVDSSGNIIERALDTGGGATQLTDLTDVNTATITNRFVLVADGVDFESRLLVEADIDDLQSYLLDITGETLSDLSDIPAEPTGGSIEYYLKYNDTGDVFTWVDITTLGGGSFNNFDVGGDNGADQTVDDGDVVDITATSTGLATTVSKATTTVTLDIVLDLSTLVDGTSAVHPSQDEIIYLDNGVQKRKQINEWDLSAFNDDLGHVENATHTGEVTGATTLTVNPTAISNKTLVTAVTGDMILIEDLTDGNLKRVNASDFLSGSGDVTKVGTPVNNQIGVWTGDGTLEGTTDFTFDTSSLRIGIDDNSSGQLRLYGSSSTTGGNILIFNDGVNDVDDNSYDIKAISGEFIFGGTTTGAFLTYNSASPSLKFNHYGGGTITGTDAFLLAVDSSGNIIERALDTGGGAMATDVLWDAAGDLAVGTGADTGVKLTMGSTLQYLRVNAGATALEWATLGAGGDVTAAANLGDNFLIRGDGAVKGIQNSGISISDGNDMSIFEAVNDGNPFIELGATATENLTIQSVYDSTAQTLDRVDFTTKAVSATADKGLFRFSVDETSILDINDTGINFNVTGHGINFFDGASIVANSDGIEYDVPTGDSHEFKIAGSTPSFIIASGTLTFKSDMVSSNAFGGTLQSSGSSLTVPYVSRTNDVNSGIGGDGSDNAAIISNAKSALVTSDAGATTNVELFGSAALFGASTPGEGVLRFNDVTTIPVGTMTSGGLLYVTGTTLHFLDDAGTDTNLLAAGSGDVSKVGTPVDNQIGVWTGDGTLEGDTNLIWNGTRLGVGGVTNDYLHVRINATSTTISGVTIENTNSGDARIAFKVAAKNWSIGIDNSDLDSFKIAQGLDVGINPDFVITTDGVITAPNMTTAEIDTAGNPALITKEYGDANYSAGSGDVTAASNLGDNFLIRGDGATKGVQNTAIVISDGNDISIYEAVNDGNPFIELGSSATETLKIQTFYNGGTQVLDRVDFTTFTTSGTANDGSFNFLVDEINALQINDTGILFSITDFGINWLDGYSIIGNAAAITYEAPTGTFHNFTVNGSLILKIDSGGVDVIGTLDATALSVGTVAITATPAELNILDLSATALTTGWGYFADGASAASWRQLLHSEINDDKTYEKSIWIPDPTATDDFGLWTTDIAITITKVETYIKGGTSVTFNISHNTNPTTITDLWTADKVANTLTTVQSHSGSVNDDTVAAGEAIRYMASGVVGSPTGILLTIFYTID